MPSPNQILPRHLAIQIDDPRANVVIVGLSPKDLTALGRQVEKKRPVDLTHHQGPDRTVYYEWTTHEGRRVMGLPVGSQLFANHARQALELRSPDIRSLLEGLTQTGLSWQDVAPLVGKLSTRTQNNLARHLRNFLRLCQSLQQSGLMAFLPPEKRIQLLDELIGHDRFVRDDLFFTHRLENATNFINVLATIDWTPRQKILLLKKILRRDSKSDVVLSADFESLSHSLKKWNHSTSLHKSWTKERLYLLIVKTLSNRNCHGVYGMLRNWPDILEIWHKAGMDYTQQRRLFWGLCQTKENIGTNSSKALAFSDNAFVNSKLTHPQWDNFIDTALAVYKASAGDKEGLLYQCFYSWHHLLESSQFSETERRAFLVSIAQKSGSLAVESIHWLQRTVKLMGPLGIEAHEQRSFSEAFISAWCKQPNPSASVASLRVTQIFELFPTGLSKNKSRRIFALIFAIIKKGEKHIGEVINLIHSIMWGRTIDRIEINLEIFLDIVSNLKNNQAKACLTSIEACLDVVCNTCGSVEYGLTENSSNYTDHLRCFAKIVRGVPVFSHTILTHVAEAYQKFPLKMVDKEITTKHLPDFVLRTRCFDWDMFTLYLEQGTAFIQKFNSTALALYNGTLTADEIRSLVKSMGWPYYLAVVQAVAPFSKVPAAVDNIPAGDRLAGPMAAQIKFGEKILHLNDAPRQSPTVAVPFQLKQKTLDIDPSERDKDGKISGILAKINQTRDQNMSKREAQDRLVADLNAYAACARTDDQSETLLQHEEDVLAAALSLAVHDSQLLELFRIGSEARQLKYDSPLDLEILERFFSDRDALPRVFADLVGRTGQFSGVDRAYFLAPTHKVRRIIKGAKQLTDKLREVWASSLTEEKRKAIVYFIVSPYLQNDIADHVLSVPDLEPELRWEIEKVAQQDPVIQNAAKQAEILSAKFFHPVVVAIKNEKARYREVSTEPVSLILDEVDSLGFAFNGWTTGLCTANDVKLYKKTKLLGLKYPSQRIVIGFSRFQTVIENGQRTLLLIDINPWPEFVQGIDSRVLFHSWIAAAKEFAKLNNYPGGVLLSAHPDIHSNDTSFKQEIQLGHIDPTHVSGRTPYRPLKLKRKVRWSENADYDFSDVLEL